MNEAKVARERKCQHCQRIMRLTARQMKLHAEECLSQKVKEQRLNQERRKLRND